MDDPISNRDIEMSLFGLRLGLYPREGEVEIVGPLQAEAADINLRNWSVSIDGFGAIAERARSAIDLLYERFPVIVWR